MQRAFNIVIGLALVVALYHTAFAVDAQLPVGARLAASVPETLCFLDSVDYLDTAGYVLAGQGGNMVAPHLNGTGAVGVVAARFLVPPNWDGTSNWTCNGYFAPDDAASSGTTINWDIHYVTLVEGEDPDANVTTLDETWSWTHPTENEINISGDFTFSAANLTAGGIVAVRMDREYADANDTYGDHIAIFQVCCDYN